MNKLSKKRLFSNAFFHARHMLSGILFLLSAAIILAVSLIKPDALSTLRSMTVQMLNPAIDLITSPIDYAQTTLDNINETLNLRDENTRLRDKNQRLTEWYLTAQSLAAENAALRKLVGATNIPSLQDMPYVTATILNDTSHDFSQSLLIKAGRAQNVNKNAIVISSYGLVGRVLEAANQTARVLLITDINARIPVTIEIEGQMIQAIMAGQNDQNPTLTHIADKLMIETLLQHEGAHIMTSGTGGVFPYGISIGTLEVNKNGSFSVSPYMRGNQFQFVKILTRGQSE